MSTRRLEVAAAVMGREGMVGDMSIEDGRVSEVGLAGNGAGVAIPGFVDLQVNGFGGVDFLAANSDQLLAAALAMARTGVVAFQPTLITAPQTDLVSAVKAIDEATRRDNKGAALAGIHLEGPFLSPARTGTHPSEFLRQPDGDWLQPVLASGRVTMVTLAPELPGSIDLIAQLTQQGITVSLGHSDATAPQARAGFAAGARAVTHLFNAMRPFQPRDPGIVGAALADESIYLGTISDRIHLADETVVMIWRSGSSRMIVVSDAIAAAGSGAAHAHLGRVAVEVSDGAARRGDGTLAGSVVTMDQAFRNLLELGIPLVDAVQATSGNARRLMGWPDGALRPGAPADVVVLDDNYQVQQALIAGRPAF